MAENQEGLPGVTFSKWRERVTKKYKKRRNRNIVVQGSDGWVIKRVSWDEHHPFIHAVLPPAFGPGMEKYITVNGYNNVDLNWRGREKFFYGVETWDDQSPLTRMKAKFLG